MKSKIPAEGHLSRIILMSTVLGCAMSSSISRAQSNVCGPAHRNAGSTQVRVLILRPRVKFWKDTLFSRSESGGAAEAVQAGFHGVLSRTFEDKGYTLRFDPTVMAQWEETPPNDVAIKALWDDYDSLLFAPFSRFPQDCKKILESSLQGDLKKVRDSNEFDTVVLARAEGVVLTKSAKLNLWDRDGLDFSIGVVDGSSGRLLYYCKSTASGKYMDEPDSHLSGPVRKCLKQYFGGGPKHP